MQNFKLRDMIAGKRVLFIPVYSMRSYETGLYDLSCDGNMARIMSIILTSNVEHATITIPSHDMLSADVSEVIHGKFKPTEITQRITLLNCDGYGLNAYATRTSDDIIKNIRNKCGDAYLSSYDMIIVEPQEAAKKLLSIKLSGEITSELLYWCVASRTSKGNVWFTDDFVEDDLFLASRMQTACATKSQVEFLGGKSFIAEFYDLASCNKPVIFFPFRLSDEEYCASKLAEMLAAYVKEYNDWFDLLVTDPNSIGLDAFTSHGISPIKAPTTHSIYMAILKGKPLIPYFAQADVIKHISAEEMVQCGCDILMYENEEYASFSNVHMVRDDNEFYLCLRHYLQTR